MPDHHLWMLLFVHAKAGEGGDMLNGQRTSSGNVIWGRGGGKAGDGGCLRYSDAWQIFKKQRLPLLRW